jgi:hypothetical protein
MPNLIADQVLEFYEAVFGQIFTEPFHARITERQKRRVVVRQIEDSAEAAAQSLIRFFLNEQLTETQVADVLNGFASLPTLLKLEHIANPNVAPESVVKTLLIDMPPPKTVSRAKQAAVYRVALHSIVQSLMLVGPVMAEWQRLEFSSTFELPRRVIDQLNAITEQLNALTPSGQTAEDERYELSYRDYLLQRFYRVEAGTVRMTTNMAVDLRELFVMPRVVARPQLKGSDGKETIEAALLLDLAAARKILGELSGSKEDGEKKSKPVPALEQVKRAARNVIIGLPGSGKSTFLEWLQLKIAADKVVCDKGAERTIPILLRVRQLNPKKLPTGVALIEQATGSKDRAALMPAGWLERQMKAGRVLFMLDGLDETEPELCDEFLLPWLAELCTEYQKCSYLISSRPAGYPPGALHDFDFKECDLQNFSEDEVKEYVHHWCTAIRLSQNEPEEEARREGAIEGEQIFSDFKSHPYIQNLAHNPLMLSAICLVNYFEHGQLPKDRAVLYRLCVEGLLHYWDQRRGIRSVFSLEEKLRTCREVAIAMQKDDRAEYEATRVQRIFSVVLGDAARGQLLLEHIRYRTGLLIERRAGVFAFAHLTFQEYLAAVAVHEGNKSDINAERLAREHNDGRWKEVIALYCGSASTTAARKMIGRLIAQPNTLALSEVLAEAYLSSGPELSQDKKLRWKVLERIAVAPQSRPSQLSRFPSEEVAPIASFRAGKIKSKNALSESYRWLYEHPNALNENMLFEQLQDWRTMSAVQVCELNSLLHRYGSSSTLIKIADDTDMYMAAGIEFSDFENYGIQAEIALMGLSERASESISLSGIIAVTPHILRALSTTKYAYAEIVEDTFIHQFLRWARGLESLQHDPSKFEIAAAARQLARKWARGERKADYEDVIEGLNSWADSLEQSSVSGTRQQAESKAETKPKSSSKRTSKKTSKRR